MRSSSLISAVLQHLLQPGTGVFQQGFRFSEGTEYQCDDKGRFTLVG